MFYEVLHQFFYFMDGIEKIKKQQKASDALKVGKILFYKVVGKGLDLLSKNLVNVSAKVVTAIVTMKKHHNFKPMVYKWADMTIKVPDKDDFSFCTSEIVRTSALLFY